MLRPFKESGAGNRASAAVQAFALGIGANRSLALGILHGAAADGDLGSLGVGLFGVVNGHGIAVDALKGAALDVDRQVGRGAVLLVFVVICDTGMLLDQYLREDRKVLFEGAQGAMLDIDYGTYPYLPFRIS